MQYKSFVFPHEPTECTVLRRRTTVTHSLPKGGWKVEELGEKPLVIRGEAVMTEYEQYSALETLFREGGCGLLTTPVLTGFYAYLTELERIHEPVEDYIRCRFEFVEAPEGDTP